jgi:hypothetical protein
MRLKTLWASALFFGSISGALAVAPQPTTVGIPTSQFNFVAATQLRTEWCWAASIQMVLNWYNVPVKQADVVNRIYHRTTDLAATEDAMTLALSGTAYDRRGRKVFLHAERQQGAPSASLLIREMRDRHPMLVTVHSSRRMLHALVITSVDTVSDKTGQTITAITFRDPRPTIRGRHAAGTVRVTGERLQRFLRTISSYYLVTVRT